MQYKYSREQHALLPVPVKNKPVQKEYVCTDGAGVRFFDKKSYRHDIKEYNSYLMLKPIPCALGTQWEEGTVYEEADFEVKNVDPIGLENDKHGKPTVYLKNIIMMSQQDAKWNAETQSGTYTDKIHHGEMKVSRPSHQTFTLEQMVECWDDCVEKHGLFDDEWDDRMRENKKEYFLEKFNITLPNDKKEGKE